MENKCVFLSLGGNQGNAFSYLQQALALLCSHTESVSQLKISHYYRTEPLGCETPHWFVNAACSFWTCMSLQEVFQMTQAIEKQLGKIEKPKSADRPIDIDLLFYDKQMVKTEELEIPHPRWKERLFVLIPLADITKDIFLHTESGVERYLLQDLIQFLSAQPNQTVSLLEKNPDLQ